MRTHVSAPKRSTAWRPPERPPERPPYKNFPTPSFLPPTQPRTQDNRPQLFHSYPRLPTTGSQSSSSAVNTLPSYQNAKTFFIGCPVCLKGSLRNLPRLRLRKLSSLPLRLPCTLSPGRVPSVQGPTRRQHVALGAPWVGVVSFLQNHHDVKDMSVQEVHPHCRPCRHYARASRHWVFPRASLHQEGHPVSLRPSPLV